MGTASAIEWTDDTWNPIVGCSVVSSGCTNCYAMKMAARLEAINRAGSTDDDGYRVRSAPGAKTCDHYKGTTRKVNGNAVWTGKVALAHDAILLAPLRKRRPRRIFVNSMGDLFHESVPDDWIDKVFAVMALAPQHTFQVLTKRSKRMRQYLTRLDEETSIETARRLAVAWPARTEVPADGITIPLPNVWLGVSAEDQARANERIPDLLATPAAVRFVSAEPLLGPIDLTSIDPTGLQRKIGASGWSAIWRNNGLGRASLDWVIAGGESGPNARPMHPDWARGLRDQCAAGGVPFFFKQWGEWKDGSDFAPDAKAVLNDGRVCEPDRASLLAVDRDEPVPPRRPTMMRRVGKRAAGCLLDGREHNDMPKAIA